MNERGKNTWILVALMAALFLSSCSEKKTEEAAFTHTTFIMNTPAMVRVYSKSASEAAKTADAVFREWKRIAQEFSFSEPYGSTAYMNQNAYGRWIKIDGELNRLLTLAMDYYQLTNGAFDVTFAPIWTIWEKAGSARKLPPEELVRKTLAEIGSEHIQIDRENNMVKFLKPVQVNLGGVLRGYCFLKGYKILEETVGNSFPVDLRLGGYMLAYGAKKRTYPISSPFDKNKVLGELVFNEGVVLASSDKDHFVEIDGKRYSHIIDLRTGYPLPDFSNLVVYFPKSGNEDFMPSVVLALMGKEKAFRLLSGMKGTVAVWIDGEGRTEVFSNEHSGAAWFRTKSFFEKISDRLKRKTR